MSFKVGDEVVLTRKHKVEEFLEIDDYTPEEFFQDRDLAFVKSVDAVGNVYKYSYGDRFDVDEDGESFELDYPRPSEDVHTWNPSDQDLEQGWMWITLQQLKELKHSVNGLDSICKKVVQLYRKHNNNHGSAFQFKGV